MRRTYRGTDANQKQVVKELRKIPGLSVWVVNLEMDLVIGYRGRNFIFELKDPAKPPSARKLKGNPAKFLDEWNGQAEVVTTAEEIFEAIREAL